MRLVTWNVNSVRARLPRLLALLERHDPDVVCLQETKVTDEAFPADVLADVGYHAARFGQKSYNGVAILSKETPTEIAKGFPRDPVSDQARVVSARVGDVHVVDLYVVNGKAVGDPAYDTKLQWLKGVRRWLDESFDPSDAVVLMGDFNVAPTDADVHDPKRWHERILASTPEREALRGVMDWGLVDLHRLHAEGPGPFTWWDYRFGAFHKGYGLRIDLALGTQAVADRCTDVFVDREERKPSSGEGKPSDHAPVVVDLEDVA